MNRQEQEQFVRNLTTSIADNIAESIQRGRVPEEWDGMELRQLISDKAAASVYDMSRSRKSDYKNTILVENL